MTGCFASVFSLFAVTMERYHAVINERLLRNSQISTWTGLIWGISSFIAIFPIFTNSFQYSLALQPAKLICNITWWDRHTITIIMIVPCLITLTVSVTFIIYAYCMIVIKYMQTQAAVRGPNINQERSIVNESMDPSHVGTIPSSSRGDSTRISGVKLEQRTSSREKERRILIKSIIISGVFIICW